MMMKKKKANVIDDDDDDDNSKRFMMNAISKHTSTMSEEEEVDIPIICLDDDDDDDIEISKDYKLFLDHLKDNDDNNLGPLLELDHHPLRYETDSGRSETRKLKMFSDDSKRVKIKNRLKKRVFESIQRDNRVAERRKRKLAEVEAIRAVGFDGNQESVRRENRVKRFAELKVETLGDGSLVRTEEDVQRGEKVSEGRKRRDDELKAETLRNSVSLDRTEEDILQRGDKFSEGRKRRDYELKAETLRNSVLLDRTEEDIFQRENRIAERRKRRVVETNAVNEEAPKVVPMNESSRNAHVAQRNEEVFVGRRKEKEEESVAVVDKDYMRYLTWLVDSLKDLANKPMSNLQNDLSDFDSPMLDTLNEPVMVPEEDDLLAKVKVEQQDLESLSDDDSDIIAVGDSPFFDGEGTPFVSSKSVMFDLDKESKVEDESRSCWFRKELLEDLERPYNEAELSRLYREASIHRRMIRCRELRKGRESDYETDTLGKSYLEQFDDFNEVYKSVDRNDKARALKLLRGFFFYLKNVSHDGAFRPWIDP